MSVKKAVFAPKTNLVPTQQVHYMFGKRYYGNTGCSLGKKPESIRAFTSFVAMNLINREYTSFYFFCSYESYQQRVYELLLLL